MINKDYLKSLSPCEDRYKHYVTHYKDFSGTLEEFLDLAELTHEDKKWVFVRSIDKDKLRLAAADFAERVLHLFESKHPNDDRPRKAIEAARNGDAARAAARAANAADAAANAAYAAYAAADAAAAYAAAANAASASAYAAATAAAYAAANVAYAANAAATDAANAAAYAAAAYAACEDEKKAQIEIMKKYAREALKGIER